MLMSLSAIFLPQINNMARAQLELFLLNYCVPGTHMQTLEHKCYFFTYKISNIHIKTKDLLNYRDILNYPDVRSFQTTR